MNRSIKCLSILIHQIKMEVWYELLKEYWKTEITTGNTKEIQTLIGKKYKKFDSYDQQDANEFIAIF